MKLITSLTSPFARKVRVMLAEKKIEFVLELENPWVAETKVPQINPLGKIPVLQLDDGTTLFDSSVIVDYLDNLGSADKLIPSDFTQRAIVKRWEALGNGIAEAAATIFLERKRLASQQSPDWIDRQYNKVRLGLQAAADGLGNQSYCAGDRFSLADIVIGCALFYLDLRLADVDWRKEFPNLAELASKLEKRQSFIDTVPVL